MIDALFGITRFSLINTIDSINCRDQLLFRRCSGFFCLLTVAMRTLLSADAKDNWKESFNLFTFADIQYLFI